MADALVLQVYRATQRFPTEERFGLQSQLRRGSVSVAANLVEGCARPTQRDFIHFVTIAISSASEVRYLLTLAARLAFLEEGCGAELATGYGRVIRALQRMITVITTARPQE